MLARLKLRLRDLAAGFTDAELNEYLDTVQENYGLSEGRDDGLIVTLALALCYLAVAADAARFFKYTQGSESAESVDKTGVSERYRKMYEATWASVAGQLPGRAAPDTFELGQPEE